MDGGRLSEPGGDYRGLFDASPVPFALVSGGSDPHIVNASQGFLSTFALGRAAIIGRPVSDLLAPTGGAELASAIDRCLSTLETVQIEVELRSDHGARVARLMVHSVRSAGFDGHVFKPVQAQTIATVLEEMPRMKRS